MQAQWFMPFFQGYSVPQIVKNDLLIRYVSYIADISLSALLQIMLVGNAADTEPKFPVYRFH